MKKSSSKTVMNSFQTIGSVFLVWVLFISNGFPASQGNRTFPVDSNTVAYWTFDRYDGNVLADSSGNGLHLNARYIKDPLIPSPFGNAWDCKGNELSITHPKLTIGVTGQLTIEARIYLESYPYAANHNESSMLAGIHESFKILITKSGSFVAACQRWDGAKFAWYATYSDIGAIPLGRWVNVAVAADRNSGDLYGYIDGKPVTMTNIQVVSGEFQTVLRSSNLPFTIGGSIFDEQPLIGKIDAIHISNALTLGRGLPVKSNPDLFSTVFLPSQNLLAQWSFDYRSSVLIPDAIGIADISANGNIGHVFGKAMLGQGVRARGLTQLDKTGYFLVEKRNEYPNLGKLELQDSLSVEIYVKLSDSLPGEAMLLSMGNPDQQEDMNLSFQVSGGDQKRWILRLPIGEGGEKWDAVSEHILEVGRWHYLVGVCSGDSIHLYTDGRLSFAGTLSSKLQRFPAFPLFIGNPQGRDGIHTSIFEIDEVKIWRSALTPHVIRDNYRYLENKIWPKVNLAIKPVSANAGDTVTVPIYLSNFSNMLFHDCRFEVNFDTSCLSLVEAVPSLASPAKTDIKTLSTSSFSTAVWTFDPALKYGIQELLRVRFRIKPEAPIGRSLPIYLGSPSVNGGAGIAPTPIHGNISIGKPPFLHGDVTGDWKVDETDGEMVFQRSVNSMTPPNPASPNFTSEVADVSGNGKVTTYDAALILRHGAGLLQRFPVQIGAEAQKAEVSKKASREIRLENPVWMRDNLFLYRLVGKGLAGTIAGEFAFKVDSSTVMQVRDVSALPKGVLVNGTWDRSQARYLAAMAGADQWEEWQMDILELVVEHRPGKEGSGLVLEAANLNEGLLEGNFISQEIIWPAGLRSSIVLPVIYPLTFGKFGITLRSTKGSPVLLSIFDLRGRKLWETHSDEREKVISYGELGLGRGFFPYTMKSGLEKEVGTFMLPIDR